MSSQNDARCEKREDDDTDEKQQVATVDYSSLNAVKMCHHPDGGDGINQPSWGPRR